MGLRSGLVPVFDKNEIIYRGLASYIFNEGKRRMPYIDQNRAGLVPINPEINEVIYDEPGEKIRGYSAFRHSVMFFECRLPQLSVKIIVSNKAGLTAYRHVF